MHPAVNSPVRILQHQGSGLLAVLQQRHQQVQAGFGQLHVPSRELLLIHYLTLSHCAAVAACQVGQAGGELLQ